MPRNWLGKTLWDGNTSRVPSHCRPGTVVCVLPKKKKQVLKLPHSQGNRYPQPHSETNWLPGSPTSLFLTIRQIIRFFFSFLSVNVNSSIASLRLQCSQVCARLCFRLGVSCGVVNLWRPQTLLSYSPIACVLYIWQTLWNPEQTLFFPPLRGLTECWNNVRNAFHNVGKIPPLCQALQLVLSQCWLSSQRGHLVTVIHTVIFHREMNIHWVLGLASGLLWLLNCSFFIKDFWFVFIQTMAKLLTSDC